MTNPRSIQALDPSTLLWNDVASGNTLVGGPNGGCTPPITFTPANPGSFVFVRMVATSEAVSGGHRLTVKDDDVDNLIASGDIAPDAKRAVFGARGDIFTVPAEKGNVRNLTATAGIRERDAVWSPDGKRLAVVHLDRGNYRIAVMDLERRDLIVLSTGRQDESPSFAPNSDSLIYATRQGRDGVLETVSADGLIRQKLAARAGGDVREPVWSPFPRF